MASAITSRDNERVKYACKLAASPAFRGAEGLFFAEGVRLCRDLAQNAAPQAVFATRRALEEWPEAEGLGAEVYEVSEGVAQKLADTKTPQGLFCLFALPHHELGQTDAKRGLLLCECLQDPANAGAVVRSAAGLGFGGAVFLPGSADVFSPKALRASMGAVLRLPVVYCAGWQPLRAHLNAVKAPMLAAALEGAMPLEETRVTGPFALAIGNEGAGLSGEALVLADERVCIAMHGGVESLNAAAAAAVMMYALKRAQAAGG